jgi:hypothetical protein
LLLLLFFFGKNQKHRAPSPQRRGCTRTYSYDRQQTFVLKKQFLQFITVYSDIRSSPWCFLLGFRCFPHHTRRHDQGTVIGPRLETTRTHHSADHPETRACIDANPLLSCHRQGGVTKNLCLDERSFRSIAPLQTRNSHSLRRKYTKHRPNHHARETRNQRIWPVRDDILMAHGRSNETAATATVRRVAFLARSEWFAFGAAGGTGTKQNKKHSN